MMSKDKMLMTYSVVQLLTSCRVCRLIELQKMKHGLRLPTFWQAACCAVVALCQQKSYAINYKHYILTLNIGILFFF